MERARVEERPLLPVTWTVKLDVPTVVGVPLIVPPVDRLSPAGRLPAETDQLYGVVPPVAARVWLYAVPTVPPGRLVVELVGATCAAATAMERARVEERPLLPVTWTVKLDVPTVVGVPLIVPPVDRLSPAGRLPAETDQLYGVVPPVAARVWLYAVPTVPPGRLDVEIVGATCAAATAMERARVEERPLLPVTWTVKLDVPTVVGVPLIVPPVDRLSPAGRLPAETDQLYGVVPPVAARVWLYAVPTVPPGRLDVEIVGATCAAAIAMERARVEERPLLPVTWTVKLDVPTVVGVPLIVPPVDRLSPAGRLPAETDQLYGVVPPVAARVWLYAVPTVPPGRLDVEIVGATAVTGLSVASPGKVSAVISARLLNPSASESSPWTLVNL